MHLVVIGVDISKEWFDIDGLEPVGKERFDNTKAGFNALQRILKRKRLNKVRVCMEATGQYYAALAKFLHEKGHEVVVVNPACIKKFGQSELRRAKTDPLDARLIRQYCEEKYDRVKLWLPPAPEFQTLKELSRRREQLVNSRTREKNRSKAGYQSPGIVQSIERTVAFLEKEIDCIEQQILELLKNFPELRRLVKLVDSVPGVSNITAVKVVAELPEPLWEARSAAAFAGLVPNIDRSGKRNGRGSLSRVGHSSLRQAMYLPAVTAATVSKGPLSEFYQRLLKKGKAKKQALVAVARKMLGIIAAILRTGKPYQKSYQNHNLSTAA